MKITKSIFGKEDNDIEKFNWDILAKQFVKVVESHLNENVKTT